jgi:hypothetical protein
MVPVVSIQPSAVDNLLSTLPADSLYTKLLMASKKRKQSASAAAERPGSAKKSRGT